MDQENTGFPEDDMNKSSAIVEKFEENVLNSSLSNRIYLKKRQTIVKQLETSLHFSNNAGNFNNSANNHAQKPLRKSSSINISRSSPEKLAKIQEKDPLTMLKSQKSVDLFEQFNSAEDFEDNFPENQDNFPKKPASEPSEMENSRVFFSITGNFLANLESSTISQETGPKTQENPHISSNFQRFFDTEVEPLAELLKTAPHKSSSSDFLRDSLRDSLKKSHGSRNKLAIETSNLQQFPWLQLTGWTSLKNFLLLLPKTHEFHALEAKILENPLIWKELLFKSLKEYYFEADNQGFPDLSRLFCENTLSPLQLTVLMKFFRPDGVERFVRNFIFQAFPGVFCGLRGKTLEKTLRNKRSRGALVVFYHELGFDFLELMENKAFRLGNRKNLKKITLNPQTSNENTQKIIEQALEEKHWVIIQNFEQLQEETLNLQMFIRFLSRKCARFENSKLILLYKVQKTCYEPTNFQGNAEVLSSFLNKCEKIYLQQASSIKEMMNFLFSAEREEHKAQVSKKSVGVSLYNNYNNSEKPEKSLPAIRILKSFKLDVLSQRTNFLKENTQFLNLHTFLDSQALLEKNTAFLSIIEAAQSKKIRFSIVFLYALLIMRTQTRRNLADIRVFIEDLFQFLETFTISPLVFLEKALAFLLKLAHKSAEVQIFSAFFKEYLLVPSEKQLILSIKNHKYELFKQIPSTTYEENINKIISNFPEEDHIELLGLHLNEEFSQNFNNSFKLMGFLRKFDENFTKSLRKEENLRAFSQSSHDFGEFLLRPQSFFSKAETKACKIAEQLRKLDLQHTKSVRINLFLSILEVFAGDFLEQSRESFHFLEDLFIEPPAISLQEVQQWLTEDLQNSALLKTQGNQLTVHRRNSPESPSRINKKNSVLFMPTSPIDKKISQVKFEGIKKNSPSFYRSPTNFSQNILKNSANVLRTSGNAKNFEETRVTQYNKSPLLANNRSSSKSSANLLRKEFADDFSLKSKETAKNFENSLSQELIRCVIFNEYALFSKLKAIVSQDVNCLLNSIYEKTAVNQELFNIEREICANEVPETWRNVAFIAENQENLHNFFKNLLIKVEYLSVLLKEPNIMQSNVINFAKMFDPLSFLSYFLLDFSLERKVTDCF